MLYNDLRIHAGLYRIADIGANHLNGEEGEADFHLIYLQDFIRNLRIKEKDRAADEGCWACSQGRKTPWSN